MNVGAELAALFERDLTRLAQEVHAFPSTEALWKTAPGVQNSAGNLVLHLEGNLREYIGRQIGGLAYVRQRRQEFSQTGLAAAELIARIEPLQQTIPSMLLSLSNDNLARTYPQDVLGKPLSTSQFLIHVHGHFNYHLGQIDYLRRMLTQGLPVDFVQL